MLKRFLNISGFTALLIAVLIIFPAFDAKGQSEDEESPTAVLNYAFATQLGSGIYRINGRTAQVYRLAFSIPLRSPKDGSWGLRLRIPFTFGFYNFKIEDILESGLPDRFNTVALVPTLEFEIPLQKNWWLKPFGGAGVGNDFTTREHNFIFAAGLRSMAIFLWNANDIRLGNRLVYSGYTSKNLGFVDDFGVFESGLDFRRRLGFKIGSYEIDGSIFGANYLYFISPNLVRLTGMPLDMRTEWEFGFTFGTARAWRILGIKMPRFGLSYRFGTGADAIRFIIGNPFPIDSPRDKGPEID